MKKEIATSAIVAIVIGVILLLGLVGWQMFGAHADRVDPAQSGIIKARKEKDG